MKNWIKKYKNQYFAFNITLVSLPLLLLSQCNLLTGLITIAIWLFGVAMCIVLHKIISK